MATDQADQKVWDFDSYSWTDRYDDAVRADQDMYARYDDVLDAVVSTYAFHHVAHELQPKAVGEMMRVQRPGGVLALGDVAFRDAGDEEAARERLDWLATSSTCTLTS